MYDGSHSHSGGSSGAHTHGGGGGYDGVGVVLGVGGAIIMVVAAIIFAVHYFTYHAALKHDAVMTPQDKLIRSARLSISCREIVQDANGTQSVGPPCSSGIRSAALAIQLIGVPRGVKFVNSGVRGTYQASCTVISGGDQVAGGGGTILTGKSHQETSTSSSAMWLPSNTCAIGILEPSQAVEIEIDRLSVGDSGTGNFYIVRQFTVRLDPRWYSNDGSVYSTSGNQLSTDRAVGCSQSFRADLALMCALNVPIARGCAGAVHRCQERDWISAA